MSGGLVALLDDVAAIAKLAAASVDDIGAAAGRAGAKAIGVVVDDAAVTPRYVAGFQAERELPMIWKIAKGSLRNKILLILPVALLLSQFVPWLMTPLLMLGGAYLCFEGAEKVAEVLGAGHHADEAGEDASLSPQERENQMVSGAIRTDFILSAEIMAISLAEVAGEPLLNRALILLVVALVITALVYGVVALIVKMDDLGLKLSASGNAGSRAFGRGLVKGMPAVMSVLSTVGTAAMLWVGGHILLDGLKKLSFASPIEALHEVAHKISHALHFAPGVVNWLVETVGSALVGLLVGLIIMQLVGLRHRAAGSHGGAGH